MRPAGLYADVTKRLMLEFELSWSGLQEHTQKANWPLQFRPAPWRARMPQLETRHGGQLHAGLPSYQSSAFHRTASNAICRALVIGGHLGGPGACEALRNLRIAL